jgi:hypothetical protein
MLNILNMEWTYNANKPNTEVWNFGSLWDEIGSWSDISLGWVNYSRLVSHFATVREAELWTDNSVGRPFLFYESIERAREII